MADFNPMKAIDELERVLPRTTAQELEYIKEAKARLAGRSPDDNKEATKLAVEAAKMFLTIAIAILVAVGAFVQFALRDSGINWASYSMGGFGITSLCLLASIREGQAVISKAYKRAGGIEAINEAAWSVEPLRTGLGRQARLGLLSLLLLFASLIITAYETKSRSVVTMKSNPFTIEGQWTELRLITQQARDLILPLGAMPITLSCK